MAPGFETVTPDLGGIAVDGDAVVVVVVFGVIVDDGVDITGTIACTSPTSGVVVVVVVAVLLRFATCRSFKPL